MAQQYQETDIEILEEILESLKITKKCASNKNRTTESGTLEIISAFINTSSIETGSNTGKYSPRPRIV